MARARTLLEIDREENDGGKRCGGKHHSPEPCAEAI
jgi:hypothetical protein